MNSEEGRVIEAYAANGHPLLLYTAVEAARRWTFKPTLLSNVPVKVQGVHVLKGQVRQFEEVARTSEFNAALCLKYDVLISRIFVSEDAYRHSPMSLLENVRAEGIRI